jgi:hypothetical protein
MPSSESSSPTALTTGHRLIQTSEARELRNSSDYDDWEYGTEPIPGDTHWVKVRTLTQLYRHLMYVFATSDSVASPTLAKLAITEILKLQLPSLDSLKQQDPNLSA